MLDPDCLAFSFCTRPFLFLFFFAQTPMHCAHCPYASSLYLSLSLSLQENKEEYDHVSEREKGKRKERKNKGRRTLPDRKKTTSEGNEGKDHSVCVLSFSSFLFASEVVQYRSRVFGYVERRPSSIIGSHLDSSRPLKDLKGLLTGSFIPCEWGRRRVPLHMCSLSIACLLYSEPKRERVS